MGDESNHNRPRVKNRLSFDFKTFIFWLFQTTTTPTRRRPYLRPPSSRTTSPIIHHIIPTTQPRLSCQDILKTYTSTWLNRSWLPRTCSAYRPPPVVTCPQPLWWVSSRRIRVKTERSDPELLFRMLKSTSWRGGLINSDIYPDPKGPTWPRA